MGKIGRRKIPYPLLTYPLQRQQWVPICSPSFAVTSNIFIIIVLIFQTIHFSITRAKVSKGEPEEKAMVREVGGAMAPIWSSFVESGKTKAVLYVVDTSSPETIAASTVQLVELLSHPSLESISVLLVFSKLDLKSSRQYHELRNLMRLDQLIACGNHDLTEVTFDLKKRDKLGEIFEWCMRFPYQPTDNE